MKTIVSKPFNSQLFNSPAVNAALKNTHKDIPRNTFGIYDPATKDRYDDILGSHLELRTILCEEWYENGYIHESKDRIKPYRLLLDHKTAKHLIQDGLIKAMVSFQRRDDGCYAVARLFDSTKVYKKDEV
jgi:hypothetical protein